MSEEEKLQLENECLMKYSKAQMIQKYIDELEESSKLSELWCKSQEENRKLINQQKEFMEYLENCINELKKESMNKLQNTINLGIVDITKEILSKYKSIIGVDNDKVS